MIHDDGPPGALRLIVIAALVGYDAPGSRAADCWVHADGTPYSAADAELIETATASEWQLARALRGGHDETCDPDATALSELLRLADGTPLADVLAVGLRQVFLLPDDSWHAPAREERTSAFADLYRRLALPAIEGDLREAEAILCRLEAGGPS
jgi:hypothetical protein